MPLSQEQKEVIGNCKKSITFFLTNFVKLKHPSAGVLSFVPWEYQKNALRCFRENRFNIFKKTRQAGASKIAGAYALWFSMFNSYKTTLIVSRTDLDAMKFLRENIAFVFDSLPPWMREIWNPVKNTEHEIIFPNGSSIQSLTSSPDVLRSNASSLNIIDEAAHIEKMDVLWSAGWSTMAHGGSAIIISTTSGVGGWYWSTWTDAEAGIGLFNPIVIDWWDMTWSISYVDDVSGQQCQIAPTRGIVPTGLDKVAQYGRERIILDPELYGPYWSPWLEEQYRGLQEKGETWKFDQEVLARFIGSGNTVLSKSALNYVGTTISKDYYKVTGLQTYVHPTTGEHELIDYSFPRKEPEEEGLWIWKEPVIALPDRYKGQKLINPGQSAHQYVMGVDIATGKAKDYHAIEMFDTITMEQVAEFLGRCLPRDFKKIVDHLGRWYNAALAVVERNNGGDYFIDDLRYEMMYPQLWRKHDLDDKPKQHASNNNPIRLAQYGFFTSQATKPVINKFLMNYVREKPDEGFHIRSARLYKQLMTYVRKRDRAGRDTGKTEAEDGAGNFDDLVMAAGLACVGAQDTARVDATNLLPSLPDQGYALPEQKVLTAEMEQRLIEKGGAALMMPVALSPDIPFDVSIQQELEKFTLQLGAIPMSSPQLLDAVTKRRNVLKR